MRFVHPRRSVTDVTIECGAVDTLSSCRLCGGAAFDPLPDPGRWIGRGRARRYCDPNGPRPLLLFGRDALHALGHRARRREQRAGCARM